MSSPVAWTHSGLPGATVVGSAWLLWLLSTYLVPGARAEDLVTILGIGVVALVCGTAVGFVANAIVVVTVHRVTRLSMALARGLAGAAAGVTVVALTDLVGLSTTFPAAAQVILPALAAPWALDAVDRVIATRSAVLATSEELVREATDILRNSASEQSIVSDIRSTILTSVDLELAPARTEVSRQLALLSQSSGDELPLSGAGAVRDAAHDSVRPLVQKLIVDHAGVPAPLGIWGSITAIVQTQPFHPVPLACIYSLTNLPAVWPEQGAAGALLLTGLGVVLIMAILSVGNLIMRRGRVRHDIAFVATFVALQVPTAWDHLSGGGATEGATVLNLLTSIFISGILVLITSSLGSWKQRQEQAQQTFRNLLDHERIEALARARIAAEVTRDAAQALHGPVQARLAACSIAMESAARSGDTATYVESLRQAQEALNTPLFSEEEPPESLADALAGVTDPWRGIVTIDVTHDSSVASPHVMRSIAQVVEEAVSNAVRHGRARRIEVTVRDGSSVVGVAKVVEICVDDDGEGVLDSAPGLGTTLIDRITRGEWSLGASPALSGARLSARLSVP